MHQTLFSGVSFSISLNLISELHLPFLICGFTMGRRRRIPVENLCGFMIGSEIGPSEIVLFWLDGGQSKLFFSG
jgi:hypothetical protein